MVSILDLIFTNDKDSIEELFLSSPLKDSDHSVILFNYCVLFSITRKERRYFYHKIDINTAKQILDNGLMWIMKNNLDVKSLWKWFVGLYSSILSCVHQKNFIRNRGQF